jgi:hypothetical protein
LRDNNSRGWRNWRAASAASFKCERTSATHQHKYKGGNALARLIRDDPAWDLVRDAHADNVTNILCGDTFNIGAWHGHNAATLKRNFQHARLAAGVKHRWLFGQSCNGADQTKMWISNNSHNNASNQFTAGILRNFIY